MCLREKCSLVAIVAFFASLAAGQTPTAQLTGRIADASGAVIPGAAIIVFNQDTGLKRQTESNEAGNYAVPLLPPGTYRITVEKEGFKPITRSGITLQVDQTARMDFVLEVGPLTETVEVSERAPLLSSESASLGQIVDGSKIQSIPLNGRSPFRLVQLTPGILSAPAASGQFGDIPVNTTWDSNFSINGGRHQSNEVQIDGVPSTAGFFNQITTIPTIEATQEFKVQSNNLSAEWGRFGGGVINVSTRSGTNQLRGSLYEFLRNSAFDANEFFNNRAGKQKPPFRMNQFGAAAGGPVWLGRLYNGRNRTFFFADYQGTRWRRGDVFITTLPTSAERAGDFTKTFTPQGQMVQIYDPLTTRPDPARAGQYIRQPFPGNVLPRDRINAIAKNLLAFYPAPNTAGEPVSGYNNFVSNAARKISQNQVSVRIDHNLTDAWRLFGRIAANNTSLTQPDYYGNVATPNPGAVGTTPFHQRTAALDNTAALGPSTLLNVRYGFARWYQLRKTRSYGFDQRELGMPPSLVSQFQIPVFPAVSVEQYGGLGGQSYLNNGNDTHTLIVSLARIAGRHNLKLGADNRLRRINFFNIGGAGGSYSFTRAFTRGPDALRFYAEAGNAIASLLLGYPASGSVPIVAGVSLQNFYYAGYLQDDIRLSSRLTLNLGLRYETESPYTERRDQINWFDVDLPSPARNAAFPNLTGGLRFAGVGGASRHVYDWDKNNFAPRVGLAYSLTKSTVLRGGVGLFYSPAEASNNAVGFTPSSGYSATTPMVATLDGGLTPFRTLADPFPEGLVQPTRASLGAATFLGQAPSNWDAHPITPKNWQWNFDVQRQMGGDLLLDVAYAGNRGIHLAYRNREIDALHPQYLALGSALNALVENPFAGTITVGALAQPRVARRQLLLPYPQFTGVTIINMTCANSIYHSLQVKVDKRFSRGIGLLLSYTAGKLISDAPSQVSPIGEINNNSGVQNWYDLRAERAISEQDVAQALVFSYVAELPFGKGKPLGSNAAGILAKLISGWQLNGVSSYRSGFPLIVTAPIPGGGNRPNSTGRSAKITGSRPRGQAIERWFDTTAFVIPPSFSLGNVGRTLPDVRGPSLINHDLSLVKNTALSDRTSLQFRAEFFNLFNQPAFWLPNTAMGSGQFGAIRQTVGLPRVVQLALKLNF